MRVTNKMLSNSFLADMRTNLQYMQKLQQQMTSGKEIRRPSDDPFKVARAMQLHTDINTNKQYNENISDTINWLDTTDTALGQVGDVIQRVRELLVSAGNAGYSQNERQAIKDEINEKIGEVSQILNTNFDGKYIFGGTRGTTKPVDTIGGTVYENAKVVNVGDLADWKDKNIKFKNASGNELEVGKFTDADIKDISTLAAKINGKLNVDVNFDGKLKVVPNISDNSLMFVSIEDMTMITPTDGELPSMISNGDAIGTATVTSSSNTQLGYYKKDGGYLETIDDTSTDDGKQYNMINQKLKVQISQGVTMDYNVTATEVLEFKNLKGEALDLREIFEGITNHLDGKDSKGTEITPDAIKELVNGDLQKVTDAMNNLLKIRSEVGAKQNRMDSAKDKNIDANFNMTEILSKVEDIDITEKTMEYATMQTVYLASLQTSAKVIQPSLLDYL
ncbi:MAG: flagellar hook-associated protein FlgL [Clostridiaceae bacterium]